MGTALPPPPPPTQWTLDGASSCELFWSHSTLQLCVPLPVFLDQHPNLKSHSPARTFQLGPPDFPTVSLLWAAHVIYLCRAMKRELFFLHSPPSQQIFTPLE